MLDALSSFFTVIATIALYYLGVKQLDKFNKTAQKDFYHRLKTDFFTTESRILFTLIDYDVILFNKNTVDEIDRPYFEIDFDKLGKINSLLRYSQDVKSFYLTVDINDSLLNHIEDLYFFERDENITFSELNEGFGYYIDAIIGNKAIQEYISWLNDNKPFNDLEVKDEAYSGCVTLYKRIRDLIQC